MNAPLPDAIRQALTAVSLDDKYTQDHGRAFMSGVQALVRLPMLQQQRDAMAGLKTAGFVSGYRGSPLGGYDQALWAAKAHLDAHDITFQPGVNEELAATAVWGTQQLDLFPTTKKFDGVFGLWYGKGPGVDRCVDVFKHANLAGTARHGGVLAIAGDDHVAKSSTAPHQSDHIFKACGMPVFFPSTVQEILDLGLHALAMSRYAGVWCGMKTIQEVVESSTSVFVDPDRVDIVLPTDFVMPEGGVHIRWPDAPLVQEARLMDHKWYAALAYVRANRLNRDVVSTPHDRFGLIASGKAWNDLRQALNDLGLDDDTCRALGIRVHKVGVVWPLEATITRAFATGLQEILVVEEKRQVIEYQLKEELYNWRPDVRPNVLGKFDEVEGDRSGGEWSMPNPSGQELLRAKADLTPALIAKAVARRLKKLGVPLEIEARMDERLRVIEAKERELIPPLQGLTTPLGASTSGSPAADLATAGASAQTPTVGERPPWFCSGCPHNTSTRVPEGSRALGGIGCHYMATWMDRSTVTFSQMGGEGVAWVGQAPFTTDTHVFANLGDGTYFHSGLLAIRQSIAAGVNITYKILYNDAVAMTGGQRVGERPEGHSVLQIMQTLLAEGVKKLVIVSDDPGKYDGVALAPGVDVHHRDGLDALQKAFREIPGTTAIVYDQTCATEKRRRRKRGTMPEVQRHVVINEAVCEGCGDCSDQSNCLSVEPVETEYGRKRRINHSTCNQDFSCLKGFCPSFVTVEGGAPRAPKRDASHDLAAQPPLPEPVLPVAEQAWGIVVAGVGGTGVITIGQLLGMAAHLEGKGVVTQDAAGLAQKGGATWSHIQIANRPESIHTTKVDLAQADLVIACDPIVGALPATRAVMRRGRTFVALNTHGTPTAHLVHNPDWAFPAQACETLLQQSVGTSGLGALDTEQAAVQLLGDALYSNALLLGYAWQKGRVPLSRAAIRRSIELNGVQVARNLDAFEWGRHCAHAPSGLGSLLATQQAIQFVKRPSLDELISRRAEDLVAYQGRALANRYLAFVDRVRQAEQDMRLLHALPSDQTLSTRTGRTTGAHLPLTEAVAQNLFKLMAYKDEYEVARLLIDPAFTAQIAAGFEGPVRLVHHLAPPFLGEAEGDQRPAKRAFGPWLRRVLPLLAHLKFLRGTAFDPFGRTPERRTERALIEHYLQTLTEVLEDLAPRRLALAVRIARLPQDIRGYGPVKSERLARVQQREAELMAQWRTSTHD